MNSSTCPPHRACTLSFGPAEGEGPPSPTESPRSPSVAVWSGGRVARWLRASRDHMLSGLQQLCAYRSPCSGLLPSGHLLPEVTCWAPVQGGSLRCGSYCARPLEASAARGGPGGPVRTGSVRLGTRVGPRSLVASNPRLPEMPRLPGATSPVPATLCSQCFQSAWRLGLRGLPSQLPEPSRTFLELSPGQRRASCRLVRCWPLREHLRESSCQEGPSPRGPRGPKPQSRGLGA